MLTGDQSLASATIVGAGCAGLSMAYRLQTRGIRPLVVVDPGDPRPDHIWAYWDDGGEDLSLARDLTEGQWKKWEIVNENERVCLEGDYFFYRAISSERFEAHLGGSMPQVERVQTRVTSVDRSSGIYILKLESGKELQSKHVFDSRPFIVPKGAFLQHFLGWRVRTDKPTFDENIATLMDFRVSQEAGIHFIYLLPFSSTEALVESTVFSFKSLPDSWYERQIKDYLSTKYPKSSLKTVSSEKGIIPLISVRDEHSFGTPIGVRAGALRASSGYAFSQIQRQIFQILDESRIGSSGFYKIPRPKVGCNKIESWMDTVLLRVLQETPESASSIFVQLASSLDGDSFARFMRGHGDWLGRLRLMKSLPLAPFWKSALRGEIT
ncbi:MAG: hypothetical protein CFH41_00563 [Alphaproteobacteria bacterium MarineAlpha11_Bin1]|nr:MAG: hypothetical protein CFH41_00563 [Alphaproteobacteria bacterium MarineAlpha11_Bin1]|tara:strand:+ start:7791 stop:8933 length:1143 start_codon:yes stop_codon:yes gene_type:complete